MNLILVDTSSWIQHFRGETQEVFDVLESKVVVTHEFILGELALGHFKPSNKKEIFKLLMSLRTIPSSTHSDVINFIHDEKLAGKGIGWVDAHILHACRKANIDLLTHDRKLSKLV